MPPEANLWFNMIKLTHLDGEAFLLNAELIEYVESRPDTFITLTSGTRVVVRESMDEVLRRAVDRHHRRGAAADANRPRRVRGRRAAVV